MNENLEKLIELAITDGVITDKEKQVLQRKAEELGAHWDEVEMILEAKLHERKQAKTKFEEKIKKCPSCKETILALSKVCPACGYVVNVEETSTNSNNSLETLINNVEGDLMELKTIPHPSILNIIQSNMIVFFVAIGLTILLSDVFIMKNGWASFIGVMIAAYGAMGAMQYKKKEEIKFGKTQSSESLFKSIKASFEKNSRLANTYFGADSNVNKLLSNLNSEISNIESKRQKTKKTTFIVLGCFLVCIVLGSFIFRSSQPNTNYLLDGTKKTISGNIGSYFSIGSKKTNINVTTNTSDLGSEEGYNLHINNVEFAVSDKEQLKRDWENLINGCNEELELCVSVNATLVLEDENKNSIGIEPLILDYENQENLIKYMNSKIDNFSLSFFVDYIENISRLSEAKNYTISIIITKN